MRHGHNLDARQPAGKSVVSLSANAKRMRISRHVARTCERVAPRLFPVHEYAHQSLRLAQPQRIVLPRLKPEPDNFICGLYSSQIDEQGTILPHHHGITVLEVFAFGEEIGKIRLADALEIARKIHGRIETAGKVQGGIVPKQHRGVFLRFRLHVECPQSRHGGEGESQRE